MKRTQLEKLAAARTVTQMKRTVPPERYAQGAATIVDRREQRRLDRERGLVPFAVKLDGALAARLRALAAGRKVSLDALADELLRKGLGEDAAEKDGP